MEPIRTAFAAAFVLSTSLALPARADEAPPPSPSALLFGKKCGSCHTLGEGDRTGPDLLGVLKRRDRRWVSSFIRTPNQLLDGGDPIAADLLARFKGVRMPEQPLTDDELAGLLGYLDECTAKGGCKLVLGKIRHASEAKPADVELGRRLFEGRAPLAGGGPSCLSCHNVRGAGVAGGGTIAKDLTFAYARLGDAGLHAALETTPFPFMKDIYAARPLRPNETFALKAYLADAARDGTPPREDKSFLYLGVLGLLASLGGIGAGWSHRLRGVRRPMVADAKSHGDEPLSARVARGRGEAPSALPREGGREGPPREGDDE